MSNDQLDESFLTRWARQKQDAARPKTAPMPPPEAAAPEPEVDLTKLPRIEDLTVDSDITGFLRKGVPEALQKLALRRMWALDPAIRDFVEVAENQWDFNAPGGIPGLFQDLAEGTDISVWLAQATQTVLVEETTTADAATVSASDQDAAPQQIETTTTAAGDPSGPQVALAVPVPADAPAPATAPVENAQISDASQRDTKLAKQPTRRRHGGALPT